MYAVIFSARIKQLDDEYARTAQKLRTLAMEKYGCTAFNAVSEGDNEIAISYWPDLTRIQQWKNDPEHLQAQQRGKELWYSEYKVEVVRIERAYSTKR